MPGTIVDVDPVWQRGNGSCAQQMPHAYRIVGFGPFHGEQRQSGAQQAGGCDYSGGCAVQYCSTAYAKYYANRRRHYGWWE